jgi:hypothetical protein
MFLSTTIFPLVAHPVYVVVAAGSAHLVCAAALARPVLAVVVGLVLPVCAAALAHLVLVVVGLVLPVCVALAHLVCVAALARLVSVFLLLA